MVALRAADVPGHRVRRALERVGADEGGEQAGSDDPADPGGVPFVQRGDHPVRAVHAGEEVADRHAHPLWGVGVRPGHRHEPRLALGDLVVPGPSALRPVVSEPADAQQDQPRVELVQPSAENPSRSRTPGRKFSMSTSPRCTSL